MSSIAQNIPEDIIYEIFTHFPTRLNVVDSGLFPWYLGHICSRWRIAFLSSPRIWDYICLRDYGDSPYAHDLRKMKRTTDIVTFFLEKNPGCPFDLEYACNLNLSHTLEMLVKESARWRDVTLIIGVLEVPVLSRVKGRLQSMRSLSMDSKLSGTLLNLSPQAIDDFNNAFVNAPSLTRLVLTGIPHRSWETNWTHLTSLTLRDVSVGMVESNLSRASNVERLRIGPTYLGLENIDDAEIITLPRLTYLEVYGCAWIKIVKAPALQELQLVYDTNASRDIVASLLRRSNCKLTRLTFWAGFGPVNLAILQCTPELTHLRSYGHGPAFMTMLSNMSQKPDFLPQLQVLEIMHLHSSVFKDGVKALLDLMLLRKTCVEGVKPIEKLRCLMIRHREALLGQSHMMQKLRELCKELGIQFSCSLT